MKVLNMFIFGRSIERSRFGTALTLVSNVWLSCVSAIHIPALRRGLPSVAEGMCPQKNDGTNLSVLYNHIPKTGGTAVQVLIRQSVQGAMDGHVLKKGGNRAVKGCQGSF